jgi:hypothetical protein
VIDHIREFQPIDASQFPVPPDDFKPSEVLVRNRRLRWVADISEGHTQAHSAAPEPTKKDG